MGRAKRSRRKAAVLTPMELPTPEQLAAGDYERDFTTHAETNTKAMTFRNRESTILERWIREGGPGFEHGAVRAIADCQTFWGRMGSPRVIAHYGERIAATTSGNGYTQQEASDEIAFRKRMVPAKYWSVFEAVVRHNEPAGVAGSRLAKNTAQQIQSAKVVVGFVASIMAMRLGY